MALGQTELGRGKKVGINENPVDPQIRRLSLLVGGTVGYFISAKGAISGQTDPDGPGFHKENKKKIIKIGLLLAK